jgi:hypothetical protein
MTTNDQLDTILGAWMDEGPMDLPDVTRRAILTAVPTTRQARRGLFAPGRFFPMPTVFRAAAVIAIAVIAVGGAAFLLGQRDSGPGDLEPTPTPTLSPTIRPTPSAEASVAISTPSPLDGHTLTFAVPFSYRLPAGEGLVVDDSDPTWYQFRHPNPNGQGYDRGVVVRVITGGRVDPCSERSAAKPMANPNAFLDYFHTVPTMVIGDEGPTLINGLPGVEAQVTWAEPTADCPNVWLWPEEGSITDLGGRQGDRLSVVDVAGKHVLFNTFGGSQFLQAADEFIGSIEFDAPRTTPLPSP